GGLVIVERERGLIRVGRWDSNQRRKAESSTGLAHPRQGRAINGDVFRIDEDEIRAGAFHGDRTVRRSRNDHCAVYAPAAAQCFDEFSSVHFLINQTSAT